jgi:hypothetical protein
MRKLTVLIGLLLLLAAPLETVEAADLKQYGGVVTDKDEISDRRSEYACDCCQKCRAARRPVVPIEGKEEKEAKEEKDGREGKDAADAANTNGCKDCCDRCGTALPAPDQVPPEIIEDRIPPELKDKPKR